MDFDTSAAAASRSARSPTATGSPTAPRSRTTAEACVRAALDAGITTFDTADVYANGRAETVMGRALAGERREPSRSSPRSTGRPGRAATTTGACRASTSWSRSTGRCGGCGPTTSTSTRRTATTTRRRSRRRCRPSPTSSGRARRSTSGSASGPPTQIRAGHALARELGFPLVSSQPQYSMLWRVIEDQVVPACIDEGLSQIVWSPIAQGVLTGKYLPGQRAPGRVARHRRQGRRRHDQALLSDDVLHQGAAAASDRGRGRTHDGAARRRVGAAERQRRGGARRRVPPRAGRRERQGRRRAPGQDLSQAADAAAGEGGPKTTRR